MRGYHQGEVEVTANSPRMARTAGTRRRQRAARVSGTLRRRLLRRARRAVKSTRTRTTLAGSLLPCSALGVLLVGGEAAERETDGGSQARVRRRRRRARARVPRGKSVWREAMAFIGKGGVPRHAGSSRGAAWARGATWTRAASGSVRRRKEGDDGRGLLVSDRREVRRGWVGAGPLLGRLRQKTGEVEPSWATASWAD
jgi:hypothetical protein